MMHVSVLNTRFIVLQLPHKYSWHSKSPGGPKYTNSQWNPAKSIEMIKCLNCILCHLRGKVFQMQGARCVSCPPAMYIYDRWHAQPDRSMLIESYLGKVQVYMDQQVIAVQVSTVEEMYIIEKKLCTHWCNVNFTFAQYTLHPTVVFM